LGTRDQGKLGAHRSRCPRSPALTVQAVEAPTFFWKPFAPYAAEVLLLYNWRPCNGPAPPLASHTRCRLASSRCHLARTRSVCASSLSAQRLRTQRAARAERGWQAACLGAETASMAALIQLAITYAVSLLICGIASSARFFVCIWQSATGAARLAQGCRHSVILLTTPSMEPSKPSRSGQRARTETPAILVRQTTVGPCSFRMQSQGLTTLTSDPRRSSVGWGGVDLLCFRRTFQAYVFS
jgi:hypothetical protein